MQPVFIVGCQRSGTTLLAAMLGGHPDVISVPDSSFLMDLAPSGGDGSPVDPADVVDRIATHPRFRRFGFDLGAERPRLDDSQQGFRQGVEWYVEKYAAAHGRPAPALWVEHYPAHVRWVPTLKKLFPDAKFIHQVRDGRGVAASLLALDWGPNDIVSAARFWMRALALGGAARNTLPDRDFLELQYEHLLSDPEATMGRAVEFLGLNLCPAMLGSENYTVPAYARDQQQLIGAPPSPARADGWRTALTGREIEIFENETGDLLTSFGYRRLTDPAGFNMPLWERLSLVVRGQIRNVLRKLRYRLSMASYER